MRTINKYMSNGDIYSTALTLAQNFKNTEELFPVAIIYSIQKNIQTLTKIAEEVEQHRITVLKKYGSESYKEIENFHSILIDFLLSDKKIYNFDFKFLIFFN